MYTHACSCMHIAHKTLANAHAWCAACAFFSSLKARAATGPTFRQAHNCTHNPVWTGPTRCFNMFFQGGQKIANILIGMTPSLLNVVNSCLLSTERGGTKGWDIIIL